MTMNLDIAVESSWPQGEWEKLATRAAAAVAEYEPLLCNPRLFASILFTSNSLVHDLNRKWRDRDKPTNVLSFPMLEKEFLLSLGDEGPPELLGDVALAYETCAQEAADKNVAIVHHTAHLIIHGLLHLAGYDHEISFVAADKMERLEVNALAKMGIADPYGLAD